MSEVDAAQSAGDFEEAKSLLKLLRKKMKPKPPESPDQPAQPEDPYIIQRLALVTYKAKYDTPEKEIAALKEACDLLYMLDPATSNDPETLGLWGAVHKRLWDKARDTVALDKAIRSYERGFYLRNDYYNGINFAFLLNIRAAHAADHAEAVADFVQARRIREEVVALCDEWLASHPEPGADASDQTKKDYAENTYWVEATKAEAYLGMGKTAEADAIYEKAYASAPAAWMIESTKEQREKLEALLDKSPLKYVNADGD
jgi:tetratricopeptide (TPR) repeat protein